MTRRLIARLTPVAFIGVLSLAGCGGAPAAKSVPTEITVADYSVIAPATIPASLVTFNVTNAGKEPHQAAIARLDSGKTLADFQTAMKETKGPPPSWIVWMGGALAGPGAPMSQIAIDLQPGTYVWYCTVPSPDGVPHVMKGMVAAMTVTAATGAVVPAPVADINVTMKDYQWDMSTPPTAGKHMLKIVVDAGSQVHEMVLVKLAAGKTAQDFVGWAMKMDGPPPIEQLTGVAGMQAGQVNYLPVEFGAGKYAMVCFAPDAKDGQPHVAHGMVKEFTVQ